MIEEIVHVSAGLRLDGGGTAHLGRLCGRSLRRFASRRGLRFRGLHLPASDEHAALDGYRCYGGSQPRLALTLLLRQLGDRRAAYFFDHAGPARVMNLLPRRWLPPYAVQLHGIEVWGGAARRRGPALARATLLVANSAYTAERARPALPAGRAVRVVHPGIEPRRPSSAVDRELLARTGEGYILVVGRMPGADRRKGHDQLIAVAGEVARRHADARMVVVGEGRDRSRLEALAERSGVSQRVIFTGAVGVATLDELYRRAALFVLPSLLEGFGLVYVEAMAAGKPCVAVAGTAPAEIVSDGETGLLVPAGDDRALVAAVAGLLGAPELARQMGAAGRRRYLESFTDEAFAARFDPVLDELASAPARV